MTLSTKRAHRSAMTPGSSRKAVNVGATLPGDAPALDSRADRLDAGQEETFALMLADTDRRLDSINARTDAIMVRAGLA